jgi:hypothetical protein
MDTTVKEKEGGCVSIYRLVVQDNDDARAFALHIPEFLWTADNNDKVLVLEATMIPK